MLGGRSRSNLTRSARPTAGPSSRACGGTTACSRPDGRCQRLVIAHAYSAANWLALNCRRHMEMYGTTKEQLGWLALNGRRNAALNPLAVYRDPMSIADYLAARPVSIPFGLLDCDVPIDGSIAVVVSDAEYAETAPSGGGSGGDRGLRRCRWLVSPRGLSEDGDVRCSGANVSRTDLTPADLNVAELYDGFTFLTVAWLEALGICGDGEAGPFVEGASGLPWTAHCR